MYDDTPPCSPLRDEVLEGFTPCSTFETKSSEDSYYELEEGRYSKNMMQLMKTLPYLTKMVMIAIGGLLKILSLIYLEKGVLF